MKSYIKGTKERDGKNTYVRQYEEEKRNNTYINKNAQGKE